MMKGNQWYLPWFTQQPISRYWRLQNLVNFLIRQAELAEYHQAILWSQFALPDPDRGFKYGFTYNTPKDRVIALAFTVKFCPRLQEQFGQLSAGHRRNAFASRHTPEPLV